MLPLVALRETVIFPEMIVPLQVGREKSVKALDAGRRTPTRSSRSSPSARPSARTSTSTDELYEVGTLAKIAQVVQAQDGTVRAIVQGQQRLRLLGFESTDGYISARVELVEDEAPEDLEVEALVQTVQGQIEQYVQSGAPVPPEAAVAARNITEPGLLADMVAYSPDMTTEQRQELLETLDVVERLKLVSTFLARQVEILELKGRIQSEVKSELDKTQREYILREQLKAIQRELGEDDPQQAEVNELREKVEEANMPEEVKERALKEVDRMSRIPSASPEVGVIRTYVDWLVGLPWDKSTEDNLDIKQAAVVLDEDHYGLEKVKERILEYLSVRSLADTIRSPILALVGPPGVGKTSLGKSVARAMGREFVRMSLGGIHDEAEIRGHRRTYIGALPGRIIQNIKTAGTNNPVFMLDEIDKIGMDFRGDPSLGPARGPRPRAEQHLRRQLPRGALRPLQGALHRHRQPHRPHPHGPARPHGDHPAAGLHPAREGRDRPSLPGAQADEEPRPQAEERRHHRRGHDHAGAVVHARGRRPQPRARDRQRHAQGRPHRGRGSQVQDHRQRAQAQGAAGPDRASSTASWRPRTRSVPPPAWS